MVLKPASAPDFESRCPRSFIFLAVSLMFLARDTCLIWRLLHGLRIVQLDLLLNVQAYP